MKALIRWAGSKRMLLPTLRKYLPNTIRGRYIEPFCGSACLFFSVEPEKAILGDMNRELISMYRQVRRDTSLVVDCLKRFPDSRREYNRVRSLDPDSLSDFEAAARFLYLNKLCFNGIYRTNRSGRFNVPFAKPKDGQRTWEFDVIYDAASLLKSAELICDDFAVTAERAEPGDFVYFDPPYATSARRVFAEYGPKSFDEGDLERLRKLLVVLNKRGVRFLVSYADTPEGRQLVKGWPFRRVRTRRNIAGFSGDRREAYELLAANAEA